MNDVLPAVGLLDWGYCKIFETKKDFFPRSLKCTIGGIFQGEDVMEGLYKMQLPGDLGWLLSLEQLWGLWAVLWVHHSLDCMCRDCLSVQEITQSSGKLQLAAGIAVLPGLSRSGR